MEIRHIKKSYGKKAVLRDVNLSAKAGECIGILGKNGSGKSTLFSVLCGLQKGSGEFFCDGEDMMKSPSRRAAAVGFVPQSPPLIGELTALDNLRLWYKRDELERSLSEGMLKLLGVDEFLRVTVSKMSGGMKKRLSIGCAVANDPSVLLLDEPSGALDLVCKEHIGEYLDHFKSRGGITLIATHDIHELVSCDHLYLLKDGVLTLHEGDRSLQTLAGLLV
ncbi:MAG: ABC transporter ATP-binding protein [Clostridia bacterium]|nr:ABC transporter ATP-binding protein [Clostridia bacterium]